MKRKAVVLILSVALASSFAVTGCASHKSGTTTTETSVVRDDDGYTHGDVVEKDTTKTTTSSDDRPAEHHGVFNILADIIALPFRAVGALFTAIF